MFRPVSPQPPELPPFAVDDHPSPDRFLMRILSSVTSVTVPAMLAAIVWQVGESAVPVLMGLAIDRALATGDRGQLLLWLGAIGALYLTLTTAARFSHRLHVEAVQLLSHRVRATLSRVVLHPVDGSTSSPSSGVVSVLTNDVGRVAGAATLAVLPASRVVSVLFIAISLLLTSWPLGVTVLVGTPVVVWAMSRFSERLARNTREYQELLAGTVGRAADLVSGYRVIKGARAEDEATRRYRSASQQTLAGAIRNTGFLGRFMMVADSVSGIFFAAVTGIAAVFTVKGQLSIGELITVVGLTQALLPQVEALTIYSIPGLAAARASAARVLQLLHDHRSATLAVSSPLPEDPATAGQPPSLHIADAAADGWSVQVQPGELVGVRADDRMATRIAGAVLNPVSTDAVQVRLDDTDARDLPAEQYRARVTAVPHRATLFTGSLRDNLTTGRGDGVPMEVALRAAACEDFAADPGLSVGENGNLLSGGQRQRVALARALATDAPVLVLHDPTTAVDSVTEHEIAQRLPPLRAGRSTLLITTSPALLARCDRVVCLIDHGAPR